MADGDAHDARHDECVQKKGQATPTSRVFTTPAFVDIYLCSFSVKLPPKEPRLPLFLTQGGGVWDLVEAGASSRLAIVELATKTTRDCPDGCNTLTATKTGKTESKYTDKKNCCVVIDCYINITSSLSPKISRRVGGSVRDW